jgi:hypothetical protein
MKKLDAFIDGQYFASSVQFKTCKDFKAFLESKYPGKKFKCYYSK